MRSLGNKSGVRNEGATGWLESEGNPNHERCDKTALDVGRGLSLWRIAIANQARVCRRCGLRHGGRRNRHNLIKNNILIFLGTRLRGRKCKPFDSDTKIRILLAGEVRFYYPDDSIICRQNDEQDTFQDEPLVLFEVLSESTCRLDLGEKKDAYLTIPSLKAYVLVELDSPTVIVFRRTRKGFARQEYTGLDAVLALKEAGTKLPLAEIYEDVKFCDQPNEPRK